MGTPGRTRSTTYLRPNPSRYFLTHPCWCWRTPNTATGKRAFTRWAGPTRGACCTSPSRCGRRARAFGSFLPETCIGRSEKFMKRKLKAAPKFANEAEERTFWESHDSTDYVDWTKAQKVVLPNLKPTTKTISLRLPQHLLDSIKAAANARDVPYQSLIKVWLQEKLHSH